MKIFVDKSPKFYILYNCESHDVIHDRSLVSGVGGAGGGEEVLGAGQHRVQGDDGAGPIRDEYPVT